MWGRGKQILKKGKSGKLDGIRESLEDKRVGLKIQRRGNRRWAKKEPRNAHV